MDIHKGHTKENNAAEKCLTEAEMALRRKLLYQEVHKELNDHIKKTDDDSNDNEPLAKSKKVVALKPRRIYRPKSKRVGLTKIRMEDCLRCDACSCIYIDPADYFKHMRNFHQKYNTIIPRSRKKSPVRISNAVNTSELNINANKLLCDDGHAPTNDHVASKQIREKIKIRWSQVVSKRLCGQTKAIKVEPLEEADMSLLLSNVEVNIKTEPPDF